MKEKQDHIYAATSIAITVMLSLIAVFMGLSSVNSRADGYTYTKIASRGIQRLEARNSASTLSRVRSIIVATSIL
jgi:hypothetical protein